MSGRADANIDFDSLVGMLRHLGFEERTRGSHRIFVKSGVEPLVDLQRSAAQAKRYQVKQIRTLLDRYRLEVEE